MDKDRKKEIKKFKKLRNKTTSKLRKLQSKLLSLKIKGKGESEKALYYKDQILHLQAEREELHNHRIPSSTVIKRSFSQYKKEKEEQARIEAAKQKAKAVEERQKKIQVFAHSYIYLFKDTIKGCLLSHERNLKAKSKHSGIARYEKVLSLRFEARYACEETKDDIKDTDLITALHLYKDRSTHLGGYRFSGVSSFKTLFTTRDVVVSRDYYGSPVKTSTGIAMTTFGSFLLSPIIDEIKKLCAEVQNELSAEGELFEKHPIEVKSSKHSDSYRNSNDDSITVYDYVDNGYDINVDFQWLT